MYSTYLLTSLLYLVSIVESNDIMLGQATPYSKKIYSDIKTANPAIWQRTEDLMISAPNNEIIDAVYVTDLRPEKDGLAYIQAGGIGSKTVTIALKSPSILRGYNFAIEVYGQKVQPGYIGGGPLHQAYGVKGGLSGYGVQYPVTGFHSSGSIYPNYPNNYPHYKK